MSEYPAAISYIQRVATWLLLLTLAACSTSPPYGPSYPVVPAPSDSDPIAGLIAEAPASRSVQSKNLPALEKMGFSVQVGAFTQVENAARFETMLDRKGLDAYYFRDPSGLFKVRFGNHANYTAARSQAEVLQQQGAIGRFFIVIPESYTAAQIKQSGQGDLRSELVRTARQFIGVPYLWGGESSKGFDCSGLTMVSYRINGLNLPRNSRSQFARGHWVAKAQLRAGDLVFFATQGGKRVTHVGLYVGQGKFIHAPRSGKTVRVANLSSKYWTGFYMGGRSYL